MSSSPAALFSNLGHHNHLGNGNGTSSGAGGSSSGPSSSGGNVIISATMSPSPKLNSGSSTPTALFTFNLPSQQQQQQQQGPPGAVPSPTISLLSSTSSVSSASSPSSSSSSPTQQQAVVLANNRLATITSSISANAANYLNNSASDGSKSKPGLTATISPGSPSSANTVAALVAAKKSAAVSSISASIVKSQQGKQQPQTTILNGSSSGTNSNSLLTLSNLDNNGVACSLVKSNTNIYYNLKVDTCASKAIHYCNNCTNKDCKAIHKSLTKPLIGVSIGGVGNENMVKSAGVGMIQSSMATPLTSEKINGSFNTQIRSGSGHPLARIFVSPQLQSQQQLAQANAQNGVGYTAGATPGQTSNSQQQNNQQNNQFNKLLGANINFVFERRYPLVQLSNNFAHSLGSSGAISPSASSGSLSSSSPTPGAQMTSATSTPSISLLQSQQHQQQPQRATSPTYLNSKSQRNILIRGGSLGGTASDSHNLSLEENNNSSSSSPTATLAFPLPLSPSSSLHSGSLATDGKSVGNGLGSPTAIITQTSPKSATFSINFNRLVAPSSLVSQMGGVDESKNTSTAPAGSSNSPTTNNNSGRRFMPNQNLILQHINAAIERNFGSSQGKPEAPLRPGESQTARNEDSSSSGGQDSLLNSFPINLNSLSQRYKNILLVDQEKNKSPSSPKEGPASDQFFSAKTNAAFDAASNSSSSMMSPGLASKVQHGARAAETRDAAKPVQEIPITTVTSSSQPAPGLKPKPNASAVAEQLNKAKQPESVQQQSSQPTSQPNRFDKSATTGPVGPVGNRPASIDTGLSRQPALSSSNPQPGSPTGSSVKSLSSAISNLIASKVPITSAASVTKPLKPVAQLAAPQVNVPQFYFPHGKPDDKQFKSASDAETMRLVSAEFRNRKEGKLFKEDFSDLLKILGLPRYWKILVFRSCTSSTNANYVLYSTFEQVWSKLTANCHDRAALFMKMIAPTSNAILHEDWEPLMQDIVDTHPGLKFLHDHKEFHTRYIKTVIARIYYTVNRSWSGKITLTELKKSNFLSILESLDQEEDINLIKDYFSYEHFYVIYCKFWELDKDHDLLISRDDLYRHNNYAISSRIIDRIFSGTVIRSRDWREGMMSYYDFVWFLISEEDKRNPTSIEYWFRILDLDGDGVLSMYELEYFYNEQIEQMRERQIEYMPFNDLICQILDLVKPAESGKIRLKDLKQCKMSNVFFDTFINLEKYLEYEQRDPFSNMRDLDGPELSDWEKYAADEYENLVSEDVNGDTQESYNNYEDDYDDEPVLFNSKNTSFQPQQQQQQQQQQANGAVNKGGGASLTSLIDSLTAAGAGSGSGKLDQPGANKMSHSSGPQEIFH